MYPFAPYVMGEQVFNNMYKVYSVSMLDQRTEVDKGGKIIMPPSALDSLSRLNISYPMLFKLTNPTHKRDTHCGVLEFVADEGKVYLPYWMMKNLLLDEGSMIRVQSVSLPVCSFARFQPHSDSFLDITNPKAVLENALRNFACLTMGDVIAINYNNMMYELSVLELKPAEAVSIIECDINVEFSSPFGYEERMRDKAATAQAFKDSTSASSTPHSSTVIPSTPDHHMDTDPDPVDPALITYVRKFPGSGNRLDGKSLAATQEMPILPSILPGDDLKPNYSFGVGTLRFIRKKKPTPIPEPVSAPNDSNDKKRPQDDGDDPFKPFVGPGSSIMKKK